LNDILNLRSIFIGVHQNFSLNDLDEAIIPSGQTGSKFDGGEAGRAAGSLADGLRLHNRSHQKMVRA
jgi:hypothetical protein